MSQEERKEERYPLVAEIDGETVVVGSTEIIDKMFVNAEITDDRVFGDPSSIIRALGISLDTIEESEE